MEDGITRAVTRERRKRRSRGEVVRGIISIRGLGPCFYLSPFGMRLRGVSFWLPGGDPDPDPRVPPDPVRPREVVPLGLAGQHGVGIQCL